MNIDENSISIKWEKKKQDYVILDKINPDNKEAVYRMIVKYDLQNSPLKIVLKTYESYKELKTAVEKYLLERECYLREITKSL
jgi:hypothetical protein